MAENFNNYLVSKQSLNGEAIIIPKSNDAIPSAYGAGSRLPNSISEVHSVYVTLSGITEFIPDISSNYALIDIFIRRNIEGTNKNFYIAKCIKLVPNSSFYIEKTITLNKDDALYISSSSSKDIDVVCSTVDITADS